jgi:predicted XRE-type DNA-binding protein
MSGPGGKPTAAPAEWPMPGHRTVAELEADKPREIRAAARQSRIDYILKLKAEGITQAAIAERVGVNQQRISEILRQHRLKQGADQLADGDGFEHAGSDRR